MLKMCNFIRVSSSYTLDTLFTPGGKIILLEIYGVKRV